MRDFYEILEVPKTASVEEIKKAYKTKSVAYHPDRASDQTDKFKEVQEAYEVLSDPVRRNLYDRQGHMNFRTRPKTTSHPFEEIVTEFFGGSHYRGRNVQTRIEIDFLEVLTGCTKPIKLKKKERCATCNGKGITEFQPCTYCKGSGMVSVVEGPFEMNTTCEVCTGTGKAAVVYCKTCKGSGFSPNFIEKTINVKIPPGIMSGMQLRIPGEGEESIKGTGKTGDLIAFILIKDHPIFTRENENILVDIPVSYTQLVLGDTIDIPTLNEGLLSVKVPAGSQPNTKIRLKGKGFPVGSGKLGDLYCFLRLEAPKELTDDYKVVLEQLSSLEKKYITPKREDWKKKL